METVTFCGHSNLSATEKVIIENRLYIEVKNLIKQGAKTFLLGGYGEFDELCAATVKKLKEPYPHITSVLVIPYINRSYNKELYDFSEYPPLENVPKRFAISKRNQYMVDKSDTVIAYVTHSWGGAAKTLEYAHKKGKSVINITTS